MKKLPLLLILAFINLTAFANNKNDNEPSTEKDTLASNSFVDSLENSFKYETGLVKIRDFATINIPQGYKFLDAQQSAFVLTNLWGNPPDSSTLGLLFPVHVSPLDSNAWAIDITYSEEGYIKDDDAEDIDYDDLLADMQKDEEAINEERVKAGYPAVHFIGWASEPFYDKENKKLHWAKELKFGEDATINTLNYNIRILGRKGVLVLNAIGDMSQLPAIKKDINKVLASVDFADGYKYSEFNPDIDKVAAYGIGGLIAGKVLAKVGFFAILAKFWKFIILGVVAAFGFLRKLIFGQKEKETPAIASGPSDSTDNS